MSVDIEGYEGLYIVDTTAFPRPVHIVRQTISHNETPLPPYHTYKGLSIARKMAGNRKDIPNPYIYKPYMPDTSICGYKV
jgi:hypothetical protein